MSVREGQPENRGELVYVPVVSSDQQLRHAYGLLVTALCESMAGATMVVSGEIGDYADNHPVDDTNTDTNNPSR